MWLDFLLQIDPVEGRLDDTLLNKAGNEDAGRKLTALIIHAVHLSRVHSPIPIALQLELHLREAVFREGGACVLGDVAKFSAKNTKILICRNYRKIEKLQRKPLEKGRNARGEQSANQLNDFWNGRTRRKKGEGGANQEKRNITLHILRQRYARSLIKVRGFLRVLN